MYKDLSDTLLSKIRSKVNSYDYEKNCFSFDKNLEVNKELNSLFKEYVPDVGNAKTILGEIVRCYTRLEYRYFNDGDILGADYGRETCNSAAIDLCDLTNEQIKNFIINKLAFRGESREELRNELKYCDYGSSEYEEIYDLLKNGFPSDTQAQEQDFQKEYERNLLKLKYMIFYFVKENKEQLLEPLKDKMPYDNDEIYDYFCK